MAIRAVYTEACDQRRVRPESSLPTSTSLLKLKPTKTPLRTNSFREWAARIYQIDRRIKHTKRLLELERTYGSDLSLLYGDLRYEKETLASYTMLQATSSLEELLAVSSTTVSDIVGLIDQLSNKIDMVGRRFDDKIMPKTSIENHLSYFETRLRLLEDQYTSIDRRLSWHAELKDRNESRKADTLKSEFATAYTEC